MLRKMFDQLAAIEVYQFNTALIMATSAKNDMVRRAGRPPSMAVFGKCPRFPQQLLTDANNNTSLLNLSLDDKMAFADHCRREAIRSFADIDAKESERATTLRKVPCKRAEDDPLGQKVAFYRTKSISKRGTRQKRAGYQVGTFILADPGIQGRGEYSSAWVQCGGRLIQVFTQQLRPAQGFETWNPVDQDLEALEEAEGAVREGWVEQAQEAAPSASHVEPSLRLTPSTPGLLPTVWPEMKIHLFQPSNLLRHHHRRLDLDHKTGLMQKKNLFQSSLRDRDGRRTCHLPWWQKMRGFDWLLLLLFDGSPTLLSCLTNWDSKHEVPDSSDDDEQDVRSIRSV